jgi:uncharacterized glyoxalase superfamily protein PhnB
MSEVELTNQLDQAIEAALGNEAQPASLDPRVAELARLAEELRDLPRVDFKVRLKRDLEREAMSTTKASTQDAAEPAPAQQPLATREGVRGITPYLVVPDVHEAIAFITSTFGAEGKVYGLGSQGGFHSEYRIGDSMLMIGGGGQGSKWNGTPVPGALHVYVSDVDGIYQRALQAGAKSLYAPMDQPYGDRDAAVADSQGNQWYLATRPGGGPPQGAPNLMAHLHPRGAPQMIEFLEDAFGAEEGVVHRSADGVVHYARMKVGNSVIEMGEAHGEWQPMPMHFMVYVDDADNWYARAMKAKGTISIGAPANAPYGGRTGTIKDPFGNTWYLTSQTAKAESQETKGKLMAAKLFRVALQVADLDQAAAFYARLLDHPGIRIPRGSRHYFDCGPVILALIDVAKGGEKPQPTPDYIYFAVDNLEAVFARAKALDCLANDRYHDQNAGEILRRPWGEVSFYCEDPWGNGLCFVDETTLFTGR